MNAHVSIASVRITEADLWDDRECAEIDNFVVNEPGSTPFHLTGWSRAVEQGTGAHAHYLVARGPVGILAVLPCHVMRSRIFGDGLVSSGFAVGGGVLGHWPALAGHVLSLALQTDCPSVELRGGHLPASGWHQDDKSYLGFLGKLAADDEKQLAAIPRKRRADIRRALASGLTVSVGRGTAELRTHFRIYSESVRNLGTPVFPRTLFSEMLEAFGESADILTVRRGAKALASVLTIYHQGVAYPFWGGGTHEARRWAANEFMYYALMCHARASKRCHSFDFGRSKAATGAAAFKKNFGFTPHPLVYASRSVRTARARNVNPLNPRFQLAQRIWQKMPLPLANLIGPFLSRGLG